jgi:hypothetical protein
VGLLEIFQSAKGLHRRKSFETAAVILQKIAEREVKPDE